MTGAYFGLRWSAPAFDDSVEVAVPVGAVCLLCEELVDDSDSGTFMGVLDTHGMSTGAAHIECHLRSMLGDVMHLTGKCSCYGGVDHDQRPYREGARAVLALLESRGGRFVR